MTEEAGFTNPALDAEGPLNDTITTQLNHRTIRKFTDEPVDEATMTRLLEVARQTPSCAFLQQLTVLRIKDPAIREVLHASSGQPYVGGDRGELLVFIVDMHRNAQIRTEAGQDLEPVERFSVFMEGAEDAILAAQNVLVAAESLGLGTCLLGSIQRDIRSVIKALKLPKHTFPILGMLIGHPDQNPQLKPRLPLEFITGVDTYPELGDHHAALADYDEVIHTYYDLRNANQREDHFTTQIVKKMGNGPAEKSPMLDILHEQGLALR